jgi:hypothetical protein
MFTHRANKRPSISAMRIADREMRGMKILHRRNQCPSAEADKQRDLAGGRAESREVG